jgi:hypothetical protein
MYAVAIALCVLALSGSSAFAQSSQPPPAPAAPAAGAPVDGEKLPVSIGRIRLQLTQAPETKSSGLKIQAIVEVVGKAPPIVLWDPNIVKLTTGPIPFGAPTQRDILDLTTPQEFKRYPMDLNALMQWLAEKLGDKSEKKSE